MAIDLSVDLLRWTTARLIVQNHSQLDSVHGRAEQVRIELHATRRAFLLQTQADGDRRDAMRGGEERRLCRRQMHGELNDPWFTNDRDHCPFLFELNRVSNRVKIKLFVINR